MKSKLVTLWWACLSLLPMTGVAAESELYYVAETPFREDSNVELRLSGGQDLTNPYLDIYSAQLGLFLLIDPTMALGVEFGLFTTSKRSSMATLENELARHNYRLKALSPRMSTVGVFRMTPISGPVNLLSTTVIMADISVIARAGGIAYEQGIGSGPLLGAGIEVNLGITPSFGVHSVVVWDWEKPGSQEWQSRAGFRVGPSVRF